MLREIITELEEIVKGVQKKRVDLHRKIDKIKDDIKRLESKKPHSDQDVLEAEIRSQKELLRAFEMNYAEVEGQLYEAGYILDLIWNKLEEKK